MAKNGEIIVWMKTVSKEVVRFCALAYAIGFGFQAGFCFHPAQTIWLILSMWAPALAVLVCGRGARSIAWSSSRKLDLKSFPGAFAIGALPYFVAQFSIWVSGNGTFDSTQNLHRIPLVLLLNPVLTGILGTFGEELGWRGFLQPEMERLFGPTRAYLLIGVIWAYWHLPMNLAGHNGMDHRLLNSLVIFPATTIAMTFAFSWLRAKSGSIWPCVYLHGVINSVSNYWLIKPNFELTEKLGDLAVWLIVGLFFFSRLKLSPNPAHMNRL